jgi:hypothetical protein
MSIAEITAIPVAAGFLLPESCLSCRIIARADALEFMDNSASSILRLSEVRLLSPKELSPQTVALQGLSHNIVAEPFTRSTTEIHNQRFAGDCRFLPSGLSRTRRYSISGIFP